MEFSILDICAFSSFNSGFLFQNIQWSLTNPCLSDLRQISTTKVNFTRQSYFLLILEQ